MRLEPDFGICQRVAAVAILSTAAVVVRHLHVELLYIIAHVAIQQRPHGIDTDELRQAVANLRVGKHTVFANRGPVLFAQQDEKVGRLGLMLRLGGCVGGT
jgi:hypothetical protein